MTKKKWFVLMVTVLLVFGLMAGIVTAAYGDYVRTRDLPKGFHFTTNLVTEWSDFSGTMYLEDLGGTDGLKGIWSDGAPLESGTIVRGGDGSMGLLEISDDYGNSITIQLVYTTSDNASAGTFYSVAGTGLFQGVSATGTFTGTADRSERPHIHYRWLEGTISYPNEILIPENGSFKNLWVAAPLDNNVFKILDNDATDGLFVVQFPTGMDRWRVFRQVRGKPGGEIKIHGWGYEERVAGKQMWFDWGTYNLSNFANYSGWFYNDGVTCVSIRWYPNQ